MGRLEQLTLSDVIMAVTRMDVGDLQETPFIVPTPGIAIQSFIYYSKQQLNTLLQISKARTCLLSV